SADARLTLTPTMSRCLGPLRDAEGMAAARDVISPLPASAKLPSLPDLEATNLRAVAQLVVSAALEREESRGSHRRLDFDQPVERWRGRIVQTWDGES